MSENDEKLSGEDFPDSKSWKKNVRAGLQAVGGAIPFAGGFLSAAAGFWSENEQERINEFIRAWMKMMESEILEKQETLAEILKRLNLHDEKISQRVRSDEYQSLVRKTFREWAGAESAKKREYIRNILSKAAATDLVSMDVIKLFIEWLKNYSEFHFQVMGDIYKNPGATRFQIWERIGKKEKPREDSAEADLYKLLFRDLSTGSVIRQHKETDYAGNFIRQPARKPSPKGGAPRLHKSAFDNEEAYELTELGKQFVHYAMNELAPRLTYHHGNEEEGSHAA